VSALSLITAEILAEQPLTVRLLNNWGREVTGSGYKRVVVTGTLEGESVQYPEVVFEFDGELDETIESYVASIRGRDVGEPEKFERPIRIKGNRDTIKISLSVSPT